MASATSRYAIFAHFITGVRRRGWRIDGGTALIGLNQIPLGLHCSKTSISDCRELRLPLLACFCL